MNDPTARINVAVWYEQTLSSSPSVQIQDTSEGPAREVAAVDTARFYLWEQAARLTGLLALLAALLAAIVSTFFENKISKMIEQRRAKVRA